MKVLLTKSFFENDINYIKEGINSGIQLIIPTDYSEENLSVLVKEADVLVGGMITEKLLSNRNQLKLIQIPWTGVDNLDYDLLAKYKIPVANSHSNSSVVAEHAVALMFDAAKKIAYHDRVFREANWNRPIADNLNEVSPFSFKIKNSKIAIVGFGSIGKNIFKFLSGLDCRFKVFNRSGRVETEFNNLRCFPISELNNEINDIDIVFVTIPLTKLTTDLIDESFFSAVNKKSIFINVSRGEIVNQEFLYSTLKNNKSFFAAIDTWYNYPSKEAPNVFPSEQFDFHFLSNIVMSPHRSGMVQDCLPHLDDVIQNLNRLHSGKTPINIISIENKY